MVTARAEMLIRRPAAEVFAAFVDPTITSKFWFTRGSGRLAPGAEVTWHWDMYGFSAQVRVREMQPDRRILVEWSAYGPPTTIEWTFVPRAGGTTFVSIISAGFTGDPDAVVQQAVGATEGFAFVLAGLKAYLEHGVTLKLVADRFPPAEEAR